MRLPYLNVYPLPGHRSEDEGFRPLHIQDHQVDGGVAHGQQQAVQREALQLKANIFFIQQIF
jgi:hypothetical protein